MNKHRDVERLKARPYQKFLENKGRVRATPTRVDVGDKTTYEEIFVRYYKKTEADLQIALSVAKKEEAYRGNKCGGLQKECEHISSKLTALIDLAELFGLDMANY